MILISTENKSRYNSVSGKNLINPTVDSNTFLIKERSINIIPDKTFCRKPTNGSSRPKTITAEK